MARGGSERLQTGGIAASLAEQLGEAAQQRALPEQGLQQLAIGGANYLAALGRHLEGAGIAAGQQGALAGREISKFGTGQGGLGIIPVTIGKLLIKAQGYQKPT
jgi:hypothetical protein